MPRARAERARARSRRPPYDGNGRCGILEQGSFASPTDRCDPASRARRVVREPVAREHAHLRPRGSRREAPARGALDREYQVLCLFGSGISFKQIAAELGVSPKTVSTYRSRICDKLKLSSNAAIIRYAIEHHLVPSAPSTLPRRRKSPTDKSARR